MMNKSQKTALEILNYVEDIKIRVDKGIRETRPNPFERIGVDYGIDRGMQIMCDKIIAFSNGEDE